MDNMYLRQKNLDILFNIPEMATVVGTGGVGSWTAINLALIGCESILMIEMDNIEVHNMNRSLFRIDSLGMNKAVAVAETIKSIRPLCAPIVIESRWEDNMTHIGEVIFDCTDDIRTQKSIQAYAKENDLKYIKAGYEGTRIMVTDIVTGWKVNGLDDEARGYDTPPVDSFALSASIVASLMVLAAIDKGTKSPDLSFDIRTLLNQRVVE